MSKLDLHTSIDLSKLKLPKLSVGAKRAYMDAFKKPARKYGNTPSSPIKPKVEHVIERDFYSLFVISPHDIVVTFKFGRPTRVVRALFVDDRIVITSDDKFDDLPECLQKDINSVFNARSMY